MNAEPALALAFTTGLFGALHCLGMCSGIAGGFLVRSGRTLAPVLLYHATRILVYGLLGMAGAAAGRVLVQNGIIGKGQGLLMMGAGLVVVALGVGLLGGLAGFRRRGPVQCESPPRTRVVSLAPARPDSRVWLAVLGGALNGLVPCSLVFSVALRAAAGAQPLEAGLLMLAFGLGTLPTMALVGVAGVAIGRSAGQLLGRLAGAAVVALGLWTIYEGWVFFDIMRGLSNW